MKAWDVAYINIKRGSGEMMIGNILQMFMISCKVMNI